MFDFTKLWQSRYLFGPNPLALSRSDYIFFGLAAAFTLIGIVSKVLVFNKDHADPRRLLWNKLWHAFFTIGVFMLLWYGARYENIPWIGTHFVALCLLLIGLVWLGFIAWYRIKTYPGAVHRYQEENVRQKYLK